MFKRASAQGVLFFAARIAVGLLSSPFPILLTRSGIGFVGTLLINFLTLGGYNLTNRPLSTGRRLWHGGSNGRWNCGVIIAPKIDFPVLVACNRGIAAWKTR